MSQSTPAAAAVVLAGGSGSRFGGAHNKVYLPLAGRRVISWAIAAVARVPEIRRVVLTVRPEDRPLAAEILDRELPDIEVTVIDGGDCRHASEYQALRQLELPVLVGEVDVIMIHDGARPLLAPSLAAELIRVARATGGAVPSLAIDDLVEVDDDGVVRARFGSESLVRVQTPQAFRAEYLLAAYRAAAAEGFIGTDTSSCIERFTDAVVRLVPGDDRNIKVTYPQDLFIAERILDSVDYVLE